MASREASSSRVAASITTGARCFAIFRTAAILGQWTEAGSDATGGEEIRTDVIGDAGAGCDRNVSRRSDFEA
jgi:hypothetical protein